MRNANFAVFGHGTKAINIFEISHYWVAPHGAEGPTLCVSMKNGKQVNFDRSDAAGDGYEVEARLRNALKYLLDGQPCPAP